MRQGHQLPRSQPVRVQHPRNDETRALLDTLTAKLPSAIVTPSLRVVQGSPGDTHLHHRLGRLPEVRVTDQLLDRAPARVVSGVLAHELAHLMNRDGRRRRRYGLALTASAGTLLAVTLSLPGARFWLSPVTCALGLVLLALSRHLLAGVPAEVGALGEVLAQQPVRVLVRAALPGMPGAGGSGRTRRLGW